IDRVAETGGNDRMEETKERHAEGLGFPVLARGGAVARFSEDERRGFGETVVPWPRRHVSSLNRARAARPSRRERSGDTVTYPISTRRTETMQIDLPISAMASRRDVVLGAATAAVA